MRRSTRFAAGRLNAAPLAGLLAGVVGFLLPDAALSTVQASMGSRPVTRLAQQQPDPLNVDHQLQELLRLAAALEAKGDTAQVVRLWQQILVIREKQLGPEHLDIATSLNKLALLYRAGGRYGEAEPLYRRSLAIREKVLGPGHPDTATIVLPILQATCRGGVLLGASPARKAFPDATPLLIAARSAYGDHYATAVGSASQRGYALLTGLGATGSSSCDAAEMAALVKGAVPDRALLATIEQLPPPERAYGSLLGAINSQCKPLLPKRPYPRKQ